MLGRCSCYYASLLLTPTRSFVEHDSDPKRWRNAQNAEVRRRFAAEMNERSGGKAAGPHARAGVPLGSQAVREAAMKAEQEALMIERADDMHWKFVHVCATVVTLFLMLLQVLPEWVDPVPSPEYVPYVEKPEEAAAV